MLAHEVFQHGYEEIMPADQRAFCFKNGMPLEVEFDGFTAGAWSGLEMRPTRLHCNSVSHPDMHDMPVLDLASSEFRHRVEVVAEDTHNFGIVDATFLA